MLKQVVIVGGRDQRPAELLRAAGLQVRTIDEHSFETLAFAATQPDAIVLDLRGASALPAAVSAFRRKHPDTGIVIMTSTLDPALLVEAMRAGVTEVVPEPLESGSLTAAITRIARSSEANDVGQVIGFVGAKGGVGTTTIAVNVATMLGNLSKPGRALLIDFHGTGGDAAVFTGAEPRFSLADAFDNTHRLDKSFLQSLVTTVAPHTDLLAAPETPAAGPSEPQKVRRISEIAAVNYKHTVLDLPRSDRVVLDGLDHLQSIYIVINQEVATVKSATRLVTMLRQRYSSERVAVVLSRSDRDAEIAREDVERALGVRIAHTFPSNYRVALQALNKGRPLALDNLNELSASFRRFAQQLSGIRPREQADRAPGLLARLTYRRA